MWWWQDLAIIYVWKKRKIQTSEQGPTRQKIYLDVSRIPSGSRLRLSSEVVKLSATQTSGVLPLDWSSLDRRVFWRCLGSICLQISCKWSFHCRHSFTYSIPERYLTPSNPSIAANTGSDASPNLQIEIVRSNGFSLYIYSPYVQIDVDCDTHHQCPGMLQMPVKLHKSDICVNKDLKLCEACGKPNLYYA